MVEFGTIPKIPVLIYDDETQWNLFFRDELKEYCFEPAIVDNLQQFERHFRLFDLNCGAIIIDARLENGLNGLDVVKSIRGQGFRSYVLGTLFQESDKLWRNSGVDAVFDKSRCFAETPVSFGDWFNNSFIYHSNAGYTSRRIG